MVVNTGAFWEECLLNIGFIRFSSILFEIPLVSCCRPTVLKSKQFISHLYSPSMNYMQIKNTPPHSYLILPDLILLVYCRCFSLGLAEVGNINFYIDFHWPCLYFPCFVFFYPGKANLPHILCKCEMKNKLATIQNHLQAAVVGFVSPTEIS